MGVITALTVFAIDNLVCETQERDLTVLKIYVKLLSLGTKVLREFLEKECMSSPPIIGSVPIEQCMDHFCRFVCELVYLRDAMRTNHLNDETTLGCFLRILNADIAA